MQNKKNKNKLWLLVGIVAAVLLIAALVGAWFLLQPKAEPAADNSKSFTVEVVHGDGSKKVFKYTSEEKYLGTVLQAEGLVSGEQGEFGLYTKVVDGEKAVYEEDNAYWGIYIGEEQAQTGLDGIVITDGAVYKLVYTKA